MIDVLRWQRAIAAVGLEMQTFDVAAGAVGVWPQAEFTVCSGARRVHVELWVVPPLWFTARITDDVGDGSGRAPLVIRDVGLHLVLRAVCSRAREGAISLADSS